jgi:hypothetical protein
MAQTSTKLLIGGGIAAMVLFALALIWVRGEALMLDLSALAGMLCF